MTDQKNNFQAFKDRGEKLVLEDLVNGRYGMPNNPNAVAASTWLSSKSAKRLFWIGVFTLLASIVAAGASVLALFC